MQKSQKYFEFFEEKNLAREDTRLQFTQDSRTPVEIFGNMEFKKKSRTARSTLSLQLC